MKVLVTGATGFIGSHLVEALVKKGYQVWCLVRRSSNLQWLKTLPIQYVYGELVDKPSLINAVKDKDIIYHIAGLVKAPDKTEYLRANYIGTKNLIEAVYQVNRHLSRFLFVSTLAAVGPTTLEHPLSEDAPCKPITDYGKSKLMAENELRRYIPFLPITIVRPPIVYGPRDPNFLFYFKTVSYGIKPILGGNEYFSIIYVSDLVEGIIQAAENQRSLGQCYFLAQPEPVSMEYLAELISKAVRPKTITLRLPAKLVTLAGWITEQIARLSGKTTIFNQQKAREIIQPAWICDTSRARKELAFQTPTSLEEGITKTAQWYRAQNWI